MISVSPLFREVFLRNATYLSERIHSTESAWGLSTEPTPGAPSIVNTAEAIYVLHGAGMGIPLEAISYLRTAVCEHPNSRGDNLRFYAYGLLGLKYAGVNQQDADVERLTKQIENRYIADPQANGWGELPGDRATPFSTYSALVALGASRTKTMFSEVAASIGNSFRVQPDGWRVLPEAEPSLALTSYMLGSLSLLGGALEDLRTGVAAVEQLLEAAVLENRLVEQDPIPGTTWSHYGVSWALASLASASTMGIRVHDQPVRIALSRVLAMRDPRGLFIEPSAGHPNVRSIYNGIVALRAAEILLGRSIEDSVATFHPVRVKPFEGERGAIEQRQREYGRSMHHSLQLGVDDQVSVTVVRELGDGYSGCAVDLCEVVVNDRETPSYRVMKLGPRTEIESECRAYARLRHIPGIDDYIPKATPLSVDGGPGILELEAFGVSWEGETLSSIFRVLRASAGNSGPSVQAALREALIQALAVVHGPPRRRAKSIETLLAGWSSLRGGEDLWTSMAAGLAALQVEGEVWLSRAAGTATFATLGITTRSPDWWRQSSIWRDPRPMPESDLVHNDLNARNILILERDHRTFPVIIDWARLGPGVTYTDHARIEADATVEVVEQLLSRESVPRPNQLPTSLRALEEHLYGDFSPEAVGITDWAPAVGTAKGVIQAVRESLRASGATTHDTVTYNLILGVTYLTYLRRPYWDRLTVRSRAFACYLAMRCFERAAYAR